MYKRQDLANIEKEMRKIVKENLPIKPFILPRAEAVKLVEERKENDLSLIHIYLAALRQGVCLHDPERLSGRPCGHYRRLRYCFSLRRFLYRLCGDVYKRQVLDDDNQKIGYKIRAAQQVDRVPYMLVLGAKEAEAGNISCLLYTSFLLTSGQMFRTIFSSMESKTLYAGFSVTLYPFQAKRACLI